MSLEQNIKSMFFHYHVFWTIQLPSTLLVGEGLEGLPIISLKIQNKCPDFGGKKVQFLCIFELNSSLKCSFKSILKNKHQNICQWGLVPLFQETSTALKYSWSCTLRSLIDNFASLVFKLRITRQICQDRQMLLILECI